MKSPNSMLKKCQKGHSVIVYFFIWKHIYTTNSQRKLSRHFYFHIELGLKYHNNNHISTKYNYYYSVCHFLTTKHVVLVHNVHEWTRTNIHETTKMKPLNSILTVGYITGGHLLCFCVVSISFIGVVFKAFCRKSVLFSCPFVHLNVV